MKSQVAWCTAAILMVCSIFFWSPPTTKAASVVSSQTFQIYTSALHLAFNCYSGVACTPSGRTVKVKSTVTGGSVSNSTFSTYTSTRRLQVSVFKTYTSTSRANFAIYSSNHKKYTTGVWTVNGGTNTIYYCNAGVSIGNLCRGNGCSCVAGAWVATSLKLD